MPPAFGVKATDSAPLVSVTVLVPPKTGLLSAVRKGDQEITTEPEASVPSDL